MPVRFHSQKAIHNLLPEEGTIRRVSHSIFARGEDIVSCASFPLRRCLHVGAVSGLKDGDIVRVMTNGDIYRVWDVNSVHNSLFVTGACNYRCLMCPQPPCADNPLLHKENVRVLQLLKADTTVIGITGGEPTLFPDRLEEYFGVINQKFPTASVEILTNASPLADFSLCKRLAAATPLNCCWCVSISGDTPALADSITQCNGGWARAVKGVINLAKLNQQIELRLVVTKRNASYLDDIALFFYRNFPFVSHIAFMGQEIIGNAEDNLNQVWVEPKNYAQALDRSVRRLAGLGMRTSIYNIPLCLLPLTCHEYARRSISTWKQSYCELCKECRLVKACCGFFTTSGDHYPEGITPQ